MLRFAVHDAPESVSTMLRNMQIWPNLYDTFAEARAAIDEYVRWYNEERIHSALNYQTPKETAAKITLKAA